MTMTTSEMLTMLYDGVLKELTTVKRAFDKKDYEGINEHLQKAQKIIRYLRGTLDFQYEISESLDALYEYFLHTTIQINIKKDPIEIDNLMELVVDLKETYIEADRQSRQNRKAE